MRIDLLKFVQSCWQLGRHLSLSLARSLSAITTISMVHSLYCIGSHGSVIWSESRSSWSLCWLGGERWKNLLGCLLPKVKRGSLKKNEQNRDGLLASILFPSIDFDITEMGRSKRRSNSFLDILGRGRRQDVTRRREVGGSCGETKVVVLLFAGLGRSGTGFTGWYFALEEVDSHAANVLVKKARKINF